MDTRPNIILINCDDLGYGDIGCYGSKLNKTPAIDSLARDGVRFTDFYAPAPVCTPSRAGMLTGCYPKRIGFDTFGVYDWRDKQKKDEFVVLMPGQPEGLNPGEKTLATELKAAGYATAMAGKWHLGDQPEFLPTNFGFDSWYGLPYSNDMGLQTATGLLKELEYTLCPLPLMEGDKVVQQQPDQASITESYTRWAVSFMRENAATPFFLYFAHMYVHHPLFVPGQFMAASQNGAYGGAVAEVDWSVNVLLQELDALGIADNTVVIFTSDNGGDERGSNAPLRGHKGSCWEGGQRVNCILRWPAAVKKGGVCSEVCSMMDFYPTFLALAKRNETDETPRDGHSLLPVLQGESSAYKAFFYYRADVLCAVRRGRFKLHLETGELYDLGADVGETQDIAKAHPAEVARLQELAAECRAELGDAAQGVEGNACRPKGFVEDFAPLTRYDSTHPYMMALYDLDDYQ